MKKMIKGLLVTVLATSLLAGCGSNANNSGAARTMRQAAAKPKA